MRISDWSSDVCSSDLVPAILDQPGRFPQLRQHHRLSPHKEKAPVAATHRLYSYIAHRPWPPCLLRDPPSEDAPEQEIGRHTSELQSLMRISYAVFCLKKKKYNKTLATEHT